ncbi:MAG: hypothetical protein AB8E15_01585 [Bdellovibrionales bacterium]
MASKKDKQKTELSQGLRSSLESLQGALDDWAKVEDSVVESPKSTEKPENKSKRPNSDLMKNLMKQIEGLSV